MAKKDSVLKKIFGTYTPPEWCGKVGAAFRKNWGVILKVLLGILGAAVLSLIIYFVVSLILSRRPVMQTVSVKADAPELTADMRDSLTVRFMGSVANLNQIGESVQDGITMRPETPGSWKWADDDRLVFTPLEPWKLGTKYSVTLDKSLVAGHIKLSSYSLNFETEDFSAEIEDEEFIIDDTDPSKKCITFTLRSNFPIVAEGMEGLISLSPSMSAPKNGTLENRKYGASVSLDETRTVASVASEPLGVPARSVDIQISVAAGLKSTYGGSPLPAKKSTVTIPGSAEFISIKSAEIKVIPNQEEVYEQILAVTSTGKISTRSMAEALTVYKLPKDLPDLPGIKGVKNFNWELSEKSFFVRQVLDLSEKVTFEPLETEHEYESLQTFRLNVSPGDYVYIKVAEGTEFYGNYYLVEDFETARKVPSYPKEAKILSEGTVLSMRGSKKVPVLTRGLDKIYITVYRLKPAEINHIVSQSNGNMRNFKFSNSWAFNEDNVSERYTFERSLSSSDPARPSYIDFDFSDYLDTISSQDLRYGLFVFNVTGDRNGYNGDKRLMLVTDQGMIVKRNNNGTRDIFIQSIADGTPVANSNVRVISLNGDTVASAYTGQDGHVLVPELKEDSGPKRPVAFIAQKGNDLCFMPYSLNGRTLNYSDFDTGGLYGAEDPDRLSAYLFSDRGIYRPGEEVRVGMIVKAGDWGRSLGGLPAAYVITDSKGSEIYDREFILGEDGFEEIKFKTQDYSPTGTYNVYAYLKRQRSDGTYYRTLIGDTHVSVEEFLPDTLTISSVFSPLPQSGWIKGQSVTAGIKLKNLFGTDAVGNTVKAELTLTPGYMTFPKYQGFKFTDPFVGKDSYTQRLDDAVTDENGRAEWNLDVSKFARASYRLTFTADGYEKSGGRSVSTSRTVYISPLDYIIGIKADGDLSYINRGSARNVRMIAVDPDLEQTAVSGIEVSVVEKRYVSVLMQQPNGMYKYQSVLKEYPVFSETVSIPAGGLDYALPVTQEGDFILTVKDKDGNEFSRTAFSVIGAQNIQRSLSRTAELEVKCEKTDFKPGDTARLFIKAPYAGAGLIAVERDKVYTYKWFYSRENSSVQEITIPAGLEGNGYITVMYTRAYSSQEIYMSPFCYAAVPFSVSLESRTNRVSLGVPAEVRPGEDCAISYSSSRPGKIIVMAIDEGILQVARYSTPDPLSHFFRKRALEVSTAQMLDLILPDYNILRTLTAAGGGAYDMALARNLNPFKRNQSEPVAYWSGILDADSTKRTVTYRVPDYFNGRLRVMAVAVSRDTLGVAETSCEVRDDYIIMPGVPTFISPGDEFSVSVSVTNNDRDSDGNTPVTLSVESSEGLQILEGSSFSLKIPEGRDETVTVRLRASDVLGSADLTFVASSGNKSSRITKSMSVRPSMPYQVWLESGVVRREKNRTETVSVDRNIYDELSTREVALSYLPKGIARGLEFYLEKYPYGCSEQITSQAFPYLYPDLLADSGKTRAQAQEAVDNVVSVLQSRQKNDGGIGFWTYKSERYDFIDCYCALFLTEAKERGYYVPSSCLDRLLGSLRKIAENDKASAHDRAFAVYVLTRNEIVTTSYLENLKKEMDRHDKMSVAGVYMAASYKMLRMDNEGGRMISRVRRGASRADTAQDFANDLYFTSAYLYLLSSYYPEQLKNVSDELLSALESEIASRRYTTLSSSFALMGLESYLAAVPSAETGKFTVTQNFSKGRNPEPLTVKGDKIFTADFGGDARSIEIRNDESTNLFYQVTQAGFLREIPKKAQKDGIEVYREFSVDGKKTSSFKLGDKVTVTLRIRATNGTVANVAVVDMLPAGLEADIESARSSGQQWTPDYVDVREDRLVLFGTADGSARTFVYKADAINCGTFVSPPLYAEAMYDNGVRGLQPQDPVVIAE